MNLTLTNFTHEIVTDVVGVCYEYDEVFEETRLYGEASLDDASELKIEDVYEGTFLGPVLDEEVSAYLETLIPSEHLQAFLDREYEEYAKEAEYCNGLFGDEEPVETRESFMERNGPRFSVYTKDGQLTLVFSFDLYYDKSDIG